MPRVPILTDDDRHYRRRRRRRKVMIRRTIALVVVVVLAVSGTLGAVRMARSDTAPPGSATTSATTEPVDPTPSRPAPKPTSPPKEPKPEVPDTAATDAAVKRYIALGLPIYRAGGSGKYVALTFDDGPNLMSDETVEKLETYGFRATFFLCGKNVASREAIIRRETRVAALGNHSWSHPDLVRLPLSEARSQIRDTQAAVAKASGQPVRLFRPPYGSRNQAIDREVMKAGMLTVLWDVDTRDSLGASWEEILATLKQGTKPGAIILMHENHGQTQKAINRYLPWLKRQGYEVVTVPELLALDPPPVAQVRRDARVFGGVVEGR